MEIRRVDGAHAPGTIALLDELGVSVGGVSSRRLHAALVRDALRGRIDCRIAIDAGAVCGVVVAAPKAYWWTLPARRWDIALALAARRIDARRSASAIAGRGGEAVQVRPNAGPDLPADEATRTWTEPGDAWRIIFVGTAPAARGRNVASGLYRSLMADRSLVARIASDNAPSIRLHRSVGWSLYRDGGVVLAVHVRQRAIHSGRAATG